MLAASRAQQSGVRLEVNERILDSCTGLTQAIRVLIQKSKTLQREIVEQGRVSEGTKWSVSGPGCTLGTSYVITVAYGGRYRSIFVQRDLHHRKNSTKSITAGQKALYQLPKL